MRSSLDTPRSFLALQEATKTGWWRMNVTREYITFSSFLTDTLGLSNETLSTEELVLLLPPDKRDETVRTLREFILYPGNYDEYFLLSSPSGYQKVCIKAERKFINESGETCMEGILQFLGAPEETPDETDDAEISLNRLLGWQRSITRTLLGLLDESSGNEVIPHLLDLMRRNFGAKYAHIFSFNHKKLVFSCEYESASAHAPSVKEELNNRDFKKEEWISDILEEKTVFRSKIKGTSKDRKNVTDPEVVSMMAAPLLSEQGIWGFIKIEAPDINRTWDDLVQESFIAASHVIGVCLALSRSENEAVENNAFLHKLYQNMPLGYFRLKIEISGDGTVTDYEYLDVNDIFTEMSGKKRGELVGKKHSEIGPIFMKKLDLQLLEEVAYKGKIHETRGQMKHNKRYYHTTIYSPRRGDIVALFSDVTNSVVASNALRRSEEELKKVYTNIPVGIEIYDKDGYMTEVNEKEVEILMVPDKETLLGRNLFDHPALPPFAYEQLKQGKNVTFDVNIDKMKISRQYYGIDSLDQLKYLTIKCTLLYNEKGEIDNYLLIIVDNTSIYETSLRLREFESAFNSAAEIAEVGFFRWNPLGNTYFGSEQFYQNMGLKGEKDSLKTFEDCYQTIHPDDIATFRKFTKAAIAGRKKSLTYEFRVRDHHEWKWIRTICHVTEFDPDNGLVQLTGINYTINEIKKTGQRLIEAKAKAEESDRLKSAFLANMSHEIRTPLDAIVGFSEILGETKDPEEREQYVSIIKKNNDLLLTLISDILDLSRIESGSIDISISNIVVNEFCKQEISHFSPKIPQGVELKFKPDLAVENPVIRSDAKWISQILGNLLSNAIKFTSKGSIYLGYKLLEKEIEFSVEDTGVGIAPENIATIFGRFVKLNDFIPGTGLGLAICKSIVEKLGGRIGVISNKDAGARFWFTLPLQPEEI